MHLLEESLGTFGGLFETGLLEWFAEMAKIPGHTAARFPGAPDRARMPHIIGATATASDVARQARSLYLRRVVQFPHPGPALHDGFYVGLASFTPNSPAALARGTPTNNREREMSAPWARVY